VWKEKLILKDQEEDHVGVGLIKLSEWFGLSLKDLNILVREFLV